MSEIHLLHCFHLPIDSFLGKHVQLQRYLLLPDCFTLAHVCKYSLPLQITTLMVQAAAANRKAQNPRAALGVQAAELVQLPIVVIWWTASLQQSMEVGMPSGSNI